MNVDTLPSAIDAEADLLLPDDAIDYVQRLIDRQT